MSPLLIPKDLRLSAYIASATEGSHLQFIVCDRTTKSTDLKSNEYCKFVAAQGGIVYVVAQESNGSNLSLVCAFRNGKLLASRKLPLDSVIGWKGAALVGSSGKRSIIVSVDANHHTLSESDGEPLLATATVGDQELSVKEDPRGANVVLSKGGVQSKSWTVPPTADNFSIKQLGGEWVSVSFVSDNVLEQWFIDLKDGERFSLSNIQSVCSGKVNAFALAARQIEVDTLARTELYKLDLKSHQLQKIETVPGYAELCDSAANGKYAIFEEFPFSHGPGRLLAYDWTSQKTMKLWPSLYDYCPSR